MTANNQIVTKTTSTFSVDDSFVDPRFMKIRVAALHSGENLNHSSFSTEVIREAKDTFKNIPILANVVSYTDEDGVEHLDYSGHDMHIEEDKFNEGEYRMIYEERVVGIVPETCNFEIVHDDESGRDFAHVDALIYADYGNYAVDVLKARDNKTEVSAEIFLDEISFDATNNVVVVNKMRMSGITLLGEDVPAAMRGANATAFSIDERDLQSQLIKVISELNDSLKAYSISANEGETMKGGNKSVKFNELLEKYNVTVEDVDFEYEGLTDEELEAAFEEHFSKAKVEPEAIAEEEPVAAEETELLSEVVPDGGIEDEAHDLESLNVTVKYGEKVAEFSVSLRDKINALYQLVNDTYADDMTWYDVDVYDDDKYVIMTDCFSGRGYKQSYKVKKDTYTLVGDRVEVYAKWLTQDEIAALDRMKSDYSVAIEKLAHYEEEPAKMGILESDDYSLIANNEEFVELKKQENHFNMSVEEVTQKADAILTEAAKKQQFSTLKDNEDKPTQTVRPLPPMSKKAKRYGSMFEGII